MSILLADYRSATSTGPTALAFDVSAGRPAVQPRYADANAYHGHCQSEGLAWTWPTRRARGAILPRAATALPRPWEHSTYRLLQHHGTRPRHCMRWVTRRDWPCSWISTLCLNRSGLGTMALDASRVPWAVRYFTTVETMRARWISRHIGAGTVASRQSAWAAAEEADFFKNALGATPRCCSGLLYLGQCRPRRLPSSERCLWLAQPWRLISRRPF